MKLNIFGDIFSTSGYSNHIRGLSNALYNLDNEVCLITSRPQGWERMVNDNELRMITRPEYEDGVDIMIGLPPTWKYQLNSHRPFIGFFIFEGDVCPKAWVFDMLDDRVTQIWYCSQANKNIILDTAKEVVGETLTKVLEDKLKYVPHGVNQEIFYPEPKVPKQDKFCFIANKGWRSNEDRGGIQFLIKAFAEEFTSKDNVKLLIKLNPAYGIPDVSKLIDKLDIKNQDKPDVQFIVDNVPLDVLNKLYNSCNCFVSTTMGEAFNLGGIEAMSCGLPTLQTTKGGQTDYMTDANSFKIEKGELGYFSNETLYEETKWFKPEIKDIQKQLRYCFENQEEVKNKGKAAVIDSFKWTWKNAAEKAVSNLNLL